MTRIDVNAFVGKYPWRSTGPSEASDILRGMDRVRIQHAWISNLAALFHRDTMSGNTLLYREHERHERLRPVPSINPEWPEWEAELARAMNAGAAAVRCDPGLFGIAATGAAVRELVAAAGEHRITLLMAVRLEDVRQRHPNDHARDLTPADVRALVRSNNRARLLITHADRDFVEQVHFGSTPAEAARLLWDISCIWGPPEDHLEQLIATVGLARFTFGTGTPLKLPETSVARLELLQLPQAACEAIERGNLERWEQAAG